MLSITSQDPIPIDLTILRDHCRVTDRENDNALLRSLNAAAVDIENRAGVYLRSTTVEAYFKGRPDPFRIPCGPVNSITSITGDSATVPSTAYELDKSGGWWKIRSLSNSAWTFDTIYTLTMNCGFSTLPDPLLISVLELSALHFENREAATPIQLQALPGSVWSILQSYGPGKC